MVATSCKRSSPGKRRKRLRPHKGTADQSLVKAINRATILNLLRLRGPMSRAELAKVSGLDKSTVSSLVRELTANQVVREVGLGASMGGRRPVLLALKAEAGFAIGADLAVDYVRIAAIDLSARTVWARRVSHPPDPDPRTSVDRLVALVQEALEAIGPRPLGLLGIGVGVHGLVQQPIGRLAFAPNLVWRDVPLREWIEERFDVPVVVDNEANAGALAELWTGVAQGAESLFYLSVGVGVGAGIVIGGEIYRGVQGFAGEFGHTTIDPNGPPCNCGNRGCLEAFVSQRRLSAAGRSASFAELAARAHAGDSEAFSALTRLGEYLGIGIANAFNTFNPGILVIGGPVTEAGDFVLKPARRVCEQRALSYTLDGRLVLSGLGPSACAVGAGVMVLRELFRQPAGSGHPFGVGVGAGARGVTWEAARPAGV